MWIGLIVAALFWPALAVARTNQFDLPIQLLAKQNLGQPRSFAFLDLSGVDRDTLKSQCPIAPLKVVPKQKRILTDADRSSRTLQFELNNKTPVVYECFKGISCSPLLSNDTNKPLLLTGDEYDYDLNGQKAALADVAKQSAKCSSAQTNLMEGNQGRLEVPGSLWVLDYEKEIVLWNPIHENSWFRIRLPKKSSLGPLQLVQTDARLRTIFQGQNGGFLLIDWQNDFSIFKDQSGVVWNARWGAGSAAHAAEWSVQSDNDSTRILQSQGLKLVGSAGVVVGEHFYPWDYLKPNALIHTPPLTLSGRIITSAANDTVSEHTIVDFLAENGDALQLIRWHSGLNKVYAVDTNLRKDSRAKDQHFLTGADGAVYRLTADGFYRLGRGTEVPSTLRALKASVTVYGSLFVTRERAAGSCMLSVWTPPSLQGTDFEPRIKNKACYKHPVIGVTPGSVTLSGKNGSKNESSFWAID